MTLHWRQSVTARKIGGYLSQITLEYMMKSDVQMTMS